MLHYAYILHKAQAAAVRHSAEQIWIAVNTSLTGEAQSEMHNTWNRQLALAVSSLISARLAAMNSVFIR